MAIGAIYSNHRGNKYRLGVLIINHKQKQLFLNYKLSQTK